MKALLRLRNKPFKEETEDYCLITLHDESIFEPVPEEEETMELNEGDLCAFTLHNRILGWVAIVQYFDRVSRKQIDTKKLRRSTRAELVAALCDFPKKIGNQHQRQACEAVLEKEAAFLSDFASATDDDEGLNQAILKHRPDTACSAFDPRVVKDRREWERQEQERIAHRQGVLAQMGVPKTP